MNKKDRERYRKILLELRKQLTGQIDSIKEVEMTTTVKDATGDHSSYSYHMADQGTDKKVSRVLQLELRLSVRVHDNLRRHNIRLRCLRAFARPREGTNGVYHLRRELRLYHPDAQSLPHHACQKP